MTVSVVVPCHNYARFLSQCLHSVLAQEGADVELVVVDDASTDNSRAVARAIARQDRRVRVIGLDENVGMVHAVNIGLLQTEGEYFVKLDADDLLTPGSLRRAVQALERAPAAAFAYGRPRHFTSEPPRPRGSIRGATVWEGADWLRLRFQRAVNCISQPEAMVRMSAIRKAGPYNPDLPHTSDLEMWLRLSAAGDVVRLHVDQGFYRVHDGSMQRTVNSGVLRDLHGRRDAFLTALPVSALPTEEARRLETGVRKELARQALDRACRGFDRGSQATMPLESLIHFARDTYDGVTTLREWGVLQRHIDAGFAKGPWHPMALFSASRRRAREEILHLNWLLNGV